SHPYRGPLDPGATAGDGGPSGGGGDGGTNQSVLTVDKKIVGAPAFDLVDFQQVSFPGGSLADMYADRPKSVVKILSQHVFDSTNLVYPSAGAHGPPYDTELSTGVPAAKFKSQATF